MNEETDIQEELEMEEGQEANSAEQGEAGEEESAEVVPEPEPEPLQTQLLRLRADFDNYRKRTERQKGEWTQQANERLIDSLLPVLDTFELGLADAEKQEAKPGVIEGFKMVQSMLLGALKQAGLEPVDALGEVFDPNVHEAISRFASDEVEADHVLDQTRRGYRLGEKLIRPTQVVVSSGSADENG